MGQSCIIQASMNSTYLNYDQIAKDYDQRYPSAQKWERGEALLKLAKKINAKTILETGSGTGYWLTLLSQVTPHVFGVDFSFGMLQESKKREAALGLARGTATQLPYQNDSFDLLYCVDAIHHFGDHRTFISEAFRVLKPEGALAIIGHDPHEAGISGWYIYEYFDSVYETDLVRYPSGKSILQWMKEGGFQNTSSETVEYIHNVHIGKNVLNDPFLKHNATSQLALLSDETYQAGIKKINKTLKNAAPSGELITFRSDFPVKMLLGYKP